ncbi:hypothetical protein ABW19_dt0208179 [Dactylella cylindrospora]|nr:hypothetical protein ABW19_dt0208179 [Dactylella cylindrospora]
MSGHDAGEGPSVPRYHLGRTARGRLSLVSDIETIEGDVYRSTLRPVSSISTDSSAIQYTPPGTSGGDSLSRSQSLTSQLRPQYGQLAPVHDNSIPDVDDDNDDANTFGIGRISVSRPETAHRSIHTASSYGAINLDAEDPTIIPGTRISAVPPPIPIKDQKRAIRTRPDSAHTASSYAMYTPRSPAKQVRFSAEMKSATPGEGSVPPLPPHALAALRAKAASKPTSPSFFHGPPPLHGDDISPPDYDINKAPSTDDDEGRSWGEKVGLFDPKDNDRSKPWWKRRKGYCFWIVLGLAALTIVFATVVGVVVGLKIGQKNNQDTWSPAANETDFPPPGGFLGTWAFTTRLTNVSSECAPTAEGASSALWRCFPFEDPPSVSSAVWSFMISGDSSAGSNSENIKQLMISSAGNPFALEFPAQQLNLTRYLTNAYYQFTLQYTRSSILSIGGRTVRCEFPNSVLTGTLYVNNTIFSSNNAALRAKPFSQDENRGEWPGDVVISEEKFGGGRQVVCRDRATQDVITLENLTETNGYGNCLCDYRNF